MYRLFGPLLPKHDRPVRTAARGGCPRTAARPTSATMIRVLPAAVACARTHTLPSACWRRARPSSPVRASAAEARGASVELGWGPCCRAPGSARPRRCWCRRWEEPMQLARCWGTPCSSMVVVQVANGSAASRVTPAGQPQREPWAFSAASATLKAVSRLRSMRRLRRPRCRRRSPSARPAPIMIVMSTSATTRAQPVLGAQAGAQHREGPGRHHGSAFDMLTVVEDSRAGSRTTR